MKLSRREFVALGVAGVAGAAVGNCIAANEAPPRELPFADEDGYRLWLRYASPGDIAARYRRLLRQIRVSGSSATCAIIRDELHAAMKTLLGTDVPLSESDLPGGAVIVGTPATSAVIRDLNWTADLGAAGPEGFIIRSARVGNREVTVIAANSDIGALYGGFHFLRLMQTGQPIERLDVRERPALQLRFRES